MTSSPSDERPGYCNMVDLACERLGGTAIFANDEFFAPKENLLKPGRGLFIEGRYTDRGKWMDGWESRRRRTPGHDFCVIKLGLPGHIKGLNIDTNHFLGNHPPMASMDACTADSISATAEDIALQAWQTILPRSELLPGQENLFAVDTTDVYTHVKLNIFPDGGVARLRVYGSVKRPPPPDGDRHAFNLAGIEWGATVLACNDMFFGPKENLILPDPSRNMGDGWETKRRRTPGHDWVIIRLAHAGTIEKVVVDTSFFKGNYPEACAVEGSLLPSGCDLASVLAHKSWQPCLLQAKLRPDTEHAFYREITDPGPFSHIRLNIFPDGGISRLRIFGRISRSAC